jgi:phage I-like protein
LENFREIVSLHAALPGDLIATHAFEVPSGAAGSAPPEWVQLLPSGTFKGRDGRGPWKADLPAVIAATTDWLAGAEAVIDFDHAADLGKGTPAPAAGWIKQFEARQDGLWGRVEWTDRGKESLQSREYRYLSPVFQHSKDGQVMRVLRASLTNSPNLTLTALNSTEIANMEVTALLALLCQLFGLATNSDAAAIGAHAQKIVDQLKKLPGLQPNADMVLHALNMATQGSEFRTAVFSTLKLDDKTNLDTVKTALNALASKDGTVDLSQYVPAQQVAELQRQLNEVLGNQKADKASAAVDQAIKDGRLIPALRDWGIALASQDPAKFADYVKAAPVILDGNLQTGGNPPGAGGGALDASEKAICSQLGISEEDFVKNRKSQAA